MPRQPEGKLVRKIKDRIIADGGRPFKIHGSDEGLQEVGIPDLLICYKGRFVGMEVKQPGESLRPRQKLLLRQIFDSGGVAAVIETVGQAVALLALLDREGEYEKSTGVWFDRGVVSRGRARIA